MTTKFRKPIAVLTALIMVLGILPTTLFASDAAVTETLVCDGKVYVDGSTFAFGPYVTLEPGEYAVYFEGSNMSGTWRVGSNSAGATFGEGSITNPSAFSARFSVFKHAENVEAWLFGSGTCTARRITRILPGELVSEGGIGTTSTHIAYGPYCSLSPGSYRVYFYGENMSGSYDVVGSGGTYASGSVPSSTAFSVDFTIPANATSIEARIAGSGTCNARQIYRIEPGELICDGSIATTSGTTSFGPYITLQPGYYRAEYTGSGLSGTYDAVGGGSSYASGTIPNSSAFSFDFTVNKTSSSFEVRTFGSGTVNTRKIYRLNFGTLISEGTVPVNGGVIAFGPYINLPAGKYVAEIEGENMSGVYRVTCNAGGSWIVGNTSIPSSSAFTFTFELTQAYNQVEVVLEGGGQVNYRRIYQVTAGGGDLQYALSFDNGGADIAAGTVSSPVTYMAQIPASITPPQKTGYTFKGYYTGANGGGTQYYDAAGARIYTDKYSVNGNTTLYANYELNTYAVTFSADGTGYTNAAPAASVTHGGSVSFDVTLSEGYTNSGNPSVTATNGSVSSTKNGNTITYTVSNITGATTINVGAATLNTYTVKFINSLAGEQIGADQTVAHGSAATAPAVDEYVQNAAAGHYKFTGWDKAFNSVTGDLTVNTVYETEAHSGGTATCNEYAECDFCGAEYGDYADHEYGEWIQQINKTCLEDGTLGHYTCSVCGKYFDAEHNELTSLTIAHEGHKPVKTEEKASTCTEKGNIEYYTCSVCGKIFTEETCENEIAEEDTILDFDYTNHSTDERVTKNAKDAKCNEDGYTGDIYCAACDHEVTHGSVIPKESIAHTPVKTEEKAATCTEKGNIEYYTCSVCGKIFTEAACTNEITAEQTVLDFDYTNHSTDERVTKNAKDAKCNEDGYTGDIYCAACDHEVTHGSVIAKESIAHTPVKTDSKASTCTEKGNIEYYTCSVCGKIFTEETCENEITADDTVLDFDYTNHSTDERVTKNAKNAKCNEDGYTGDIYCAACDHEVTHGSVIAKETIAHTPVKTDSKASTCTEKGNIEYYTCSVCGKIFTEEACTNKITADDTVLDFDYTNHSTTETVVKDAKDATCNEDGYTGDIYCAACDHLIEAGEAIPSGGTEHVFGEWYVKTAPTCTEEGVEARVCGNCGEEETRPIAATGHSFGEWIDDADNAPSCTKDGKQHRVCAKCGETETREVTASEKGHSIRLPNDEGEGYCAFCGEYRCLFCEKDEHMHETNDASVMTFFVHIVHIFYHMFSNFRYTLNHR